MKTSTYNLENKTLEYSVWDYSIGGEHKQDKNGC
jgi:hypothetical protein